MFMHKKYTNMKAEKNIQDGKRSYGHAFKIFSLMNTEDKSILLSHILVWMGESY